MKYSTRTIHEFAVGGMTAELSFEPSCIMSYVEHKVVKQNGLVAIGYLVDDQDVQNPLEDCDGMGRIYSSHRHSGQHSDMQDALGLNSEWDRDYSIAVVERAAESALMELVRRDFQSDLVAFILECANEQGLSRDQSIQHFIRDFTGELYSNPAWLTEKVQEVATWDSLLDEAWQLCRLNGLIGNPYAVMLDCYEHGGQLWSLSGSGMQCQFDTAHGAGVWVPDDVLTEDLSAIKAAEGMEVARAKAVEFASQALEPYNDWLAGNCFGIAVDVFAEESGQMKLVDESAVWGYIGSKWAESALAAEVNAMIASAQAKAA